MSGLIIKDLVGDYSFVVVDDMLWHQITNLSKNYPSMPYDTYIQVVDWLTCDDEGISPPKTNFPVFRLGKILNTYFVRDGMPEKVKLDTIQGVITIPGY